MLMNILDPDVAERPDDLVVYGGWGRAARSWAAFDAIVATLRRLEDDETLVVRSGKPVAVFRTHTWAPRGLIANALLVPAWRAEAAHGTREADEKLQRVLTCDPGLGVVRLPTQGIRKRGTPLGGPAWTCQWGLPT